MKKIGNVLVGFFVLITLIIWISLKPVTERIASYASLTHSLGQIFGLIGMVLFALTFILTTRLSFIEDLFGGLDKVYKTHHVIGVLSFVLILFHPIFLVLKFIPSNFSQAAVYLWPSNSMAVNYGIVALLAMTLLIVLTFFVNLSYGVWKNSHRLMGFVFLVASMHIFLIYTEITLFTLLKIWMIFVCIIGVLSYAYGSYLRIFFKKDLKYIVTNVKRNGSITVIEMNPVEKELKFLPGQFLFVRFNQSKLGEKHPFSISSNSGKNLRISVKSLGDFTKDLASLKAGTVAFVEGPYGRFDALNDKRDQVWIAGGIGITPFLSILQEMVKNKSDKKVDLYYSIKNESEAVFLDELKSYLSLKNFRLFVQYSDSMGYLNSEKVEKNSNLEGKAVYFCGPSSLVNSMKSQLSKKINKKDLYSEDFNFNAN